MPPPWHSVQNGVRRAERAKPPSPHTLRDVGNQYNFIGCRLPTLQAAGLARPSSRKQWVQAVLGRGPAEGRRTGNTARCLGPGLPAAAAGTATPRPAQRNPD